MSVAFSNTIRKSIEKYIINRAATNSKTMHVIRFDDTGGNLELYKTFRNEALKRISKTLKHRIDGSGSMYLYSENYAEIQKVLRNVERSKAFKDAATLDHDLNLVSNHDVLLSLQKQIPFSFIKTLKQTEDVVVEYFASADTKIDLGFAKSNLVLRVNNANIDTKDLKSFFRDYLFTGGKKLVNKLMFDFGSYFLGKKIKPVKRKENVSGTFKKQLAKVNVVAHNPTKIKDIKEKFTSNIKILQLLEPLVTKYIKEDMDSANYFKTLTGRFTKTAKIALPSRVGNKLIIPFNYLRNYNAFDDPANRLFRSGREPSKVIDGAIRKAAKEVISSKFKIISVRRSWV